jgi:hypothetical protein
VNLVAFAIAADEPGRRLVLERQDPPPFTAGCAVALLAGLVLAPLGLAYSMAGELGLSSPGGRLVLLPVGAATLGLAVYLVSRARKARVLRRLSVDRLTDRLEIVEGPLLEGRLSFGCSVATQSVGLADVVTLQVQGTRSLDPSHKAIRLRLEFGFGEGSGAAGRALDLTVQGLDRTEEVLDLGQRLAAAAGLAEQRLLRNDPREVEIEFTRTAVRRAVVPRPVGDAMPLPEPAVRADYAAGRIEPAARALATQEVVDPFDPGAFRSDHRVATWRPGQVVRFERPFRFAALGCAPGLLGVLAGPLMFLQMLRFPQNRAQGIGSLLLGAAIFELFGVVIAAVAAAAVLQALSRSVSFDWSERLLRIRGPLRSRAFHFSELAPLELRCLRFTRSKGPTTYRCDIVAHLVPVAGKARELSLVSTLTVGSSITIPYRSALPLVVELAEALGLPHRVTGFD